MPIQLTFRIIVNKKNNCHNQLMLSGFSGERRGKTPSDCLMIFKYNMFYNK